MLQLDRQGIQDFQHLLDDLNRREAAVRILTEPLFEDCAARKLQELGLHALLAKHIAKLGQESESVHGLASVRRICKLGLLCLQNRLSLPDALVISIVGVIHLD